MTILLQFILALAQYVKQVDIIETTKNKSYDTAH